MKRISWWDGVTSTIEAMKDAAFGNRWWRDGALTDELPNGIVVDTVLECFDTGLPETGILKPGGKWIIVDQYSTKEEVAVGHTKWVALMKEHPETILKDIDIWTGRESNDE
jgi:hypothetical protein